MSKPRIKYVQGWKYRLAESYAHLLQFSVGQTVQVKPWITIDDAMLYIREGYCWDGPSGPAFDTPDFMRASCVHDSLYQALNHHRWLGEHFRKQADGEMRRICLEDGMSSIRAWWCYWAVRKLGPRDGGADRPVRVAP